MTPELCVCRPHSPRGAATLWWRAIKKTIAAPQYKRLVRRKMPLKASTFGHAVNCRLITAHLKL